MSSPLGPMYIETRDCVCVLEALDFKIKIVLVIFFLWALVSSSSI